jgi:hypothetical protein
MIKMPKLGWGAARPCAYVGRKAMMADHLLFTGFIHITSGRSVVLEKKVRGSAWHGMAWFDVRDRQGKLHRR